MNILRLAMPDSFERMPTIGIRMPNGALASLPANVNARHDVAARTSSSVSGTSGRPSNRSFANGNGTSSGCR